MFVSQRVCASAQRTAYSRPVQMRLAVRDEDEDADGRAERRVVGRDALEAKYTFRKEWNVVREDAHRTKRPRDDLNVRPTV